MIYHLGAAAHRRWLLWGMDGDFRPRIPLVVVGALRAGGSGKTSMAMALAGHFRAKGLRVAVLAYWLGAPRRGGLFAGPLPGRRARIREIGKETPWRDASDEAVLLAAGTGARVFVTRDRHEAWKALHGLAPEGEGVDVIISDDGFQDPRLKGALKLLLRRPGESPGLADLLPCGRFRETERAVRRADLVVEERPWPSQVEQTSQAEAQGAPKLWFSRELRLPDLPAGCKVGVLCGLADPVPFLQALEAAGLRISGLLRAPNHRPFPEEALREFCRRHADKPLLCTEKDRVKIPGGEPFSRVRAVVQSIRLSPAVRTALDAWWDGNAPGPAIPAGLYGAFVD